MSPEVSADDLPEDVRETTQQLLAGEAVEKGDVLTCSAWWCENVSEDNVVTRLATLLLGLSHNIPTAHDRVRLERERETAI